MKRLSVIIILLAVLFPLFGAEEGLLFPLGPVLLENMTMAYNIFRVTPSFGAATFDVNQDGWPDLLISGHGLAPAIFLNQQGRSFREASELLPLKNTDRHAPAVADFDNDGDQDIYFLHGAHDGTGEGSNEFLLNPGKGKPFRMVSHPELEDPKGRGRTGVWFDYDEDGFLDLIAVNKLRADAPNRLFHNNTDGTFSDVSAESGMMKSINSEGGAIAIDFDRDGDMDVLFNNTDDRPYLFMNQGHGVFLDETLQRGIPKVGSTWSAGVADYNDDGAPDIYFSRGSDGALSEGGVIAPNRINFLQGVHSPADKVDRIVFSADPSAVLRFSFSIKRVDLQNLYVGSEGKNPGVLDFKVGPGFLSAQGIPQQWRSDGSTRGTFIWRDPATGLWTVAAASGSTELYSGALIQSDSQLSDLTFVEMEPFTPKFPNMLLQNKGDGTFRVATFEAGVGDTSNSRSPVWVDLDNDGDLDLFVVNAGFNGSGKQPHICYINENGRFTGYPLEQGPYEQFGRGDGGLIADFNKDGLQDLFVLNGSGLLPANRGPYQLFLNRTKTTNRWISFWLVGGGRNLTNRDAIGARINLQTQDRNMWRFLPGGSGSDCLSTRTLQFGLAAADSADVTIYWPPSKTYPQGHTQTFHFGIDDLNKRYQVKEISIEPKAY